VQPQQQEQEQQEQVSIHDQVPEENADALQSFLGDEPSKPTTATDNNNQHVVATQDVETRVGAAEGEKIAHPAEPSEEEREEGRSHAGDSEEVIVEDTTVRTTLQTTETEETEETTTNDQVTTSGVDV